MTNIIGNFFAKISLEKFGCNLKLRKQLKMCFYKKIKEGEASWKQ
jgi:hypothetical protein